MAKRLIFLFALILSAFCADAQNSVGINTVDPNPNAALHIKRAGSQPQGVLIPRLTTVEKDAMLLDDADNGLMVFDSEIGNLFIWSNGIWMPMAIEGATLNAGNGISIDGSNNINLGGMLVTPAKITTNPGAELLIDGTGILFVDAPADFNALTNFIDINVFGGFISGARLTQVDNTFILIDDLTANAASFELGDLTLPQIYTLPDTSGQIALLSDLSGAGLWADNLGDINYSGGLVGIGTLTPKSTLQVEESLSFFHFENSLQGIIGDFIGSGLYVDKTNSADNEIRRMTSGLGSFMFFENGGVKFIHANAGSTDAIADLNADMNSSLSLLADGSADFEGLVRFNSFEAIALPVGTNFDRDNIASPLDGMIRYNNESGFEGFEGRVLGAWAPIGGGGLTGATNGLNVNINNIELGGSLIVNTEIALSGFEFSLRRGSPTNAPTLHLLNDNGGIGSGGTLVLEGLNSSVNPVGLGIVETRMTNATAGVESSELVMSVMQSGGLVEGLRIDDFGEVNANAYKYNAPITKNYGIAPIEFVLTKQSAAGDNIIESNFGGTVYVKSVSIEEAGAQIAAPVHLPGGAEIISVEVFGRNTTAIGATVHFVGKSYSTAVTFDDTVIIPAGTGGITGFTVPLGATRIIDNNSNNYFVYIEIPTSFGGGLADVSGARIKYSINRVN